MRLVGAVTLALIWTAPVSIAGAEDLFRGQEWANVAADRNATHVGDVLTVVVYQNAEARNAAQNVARQRRTFAGAVRGGAIDESGELSLDGSYAGQGEVRRSESFLTEISVIVEQVLDNGDLRIAGEQLVYVNGEETTISVHGRVRRSDISGDNSVLSTRIADAEIRYHGRGFVSRNARSNLVHRLLGLLGLGG